MPALTIECTYCRSIDVAYRYDIRVVYLLLSLYYQTSKNLMSEEEEMQIDNYTKFIMTVIAGALVVIALKGTGLIPLIFSFIVT